MDKRLFSSKEVAEMLGVNESSIKRWADSKKIACVKTPGGHRKFRLSDLNEYVRANNVDTLHKLPESENNADQKLLLALQYKDHPVIIPHFLNLLMKADASEIFSFINLLVLNKYSYIEFFDFVLSPVLHQIGEKWAANLISVDEEHAASAALYEALIRTNSSMIKLPKKNLNAIVGVLEHDYHELPAKCLSILLEIEGWQVYYLGANTPVFSFVSALEKKPVQAILISSIVKPGNPKPLINGLKILKEKLDSLGGVLVVGGPGLLDQYNELDFVDHWGFNYRETIQFLKHRFKKNGDVSIPVS